MSRTVTLSEERKPKKGKLDLSILSHSKSTAKKINLPEEVINNAIKEHNKTKKNITPASPEDNKQSSIDYTQVVNLKLSDNEIALLAAIQQESEETGNPAPPMSRPYITEKYGINKKYLGAAIKGVIEKGIVSKSPAKFRNQASFAWRIL
tara:strand:+ start:4078 stop:4527 length:450 start_codon:yes stop_codon:yes gene_type:complete